jgi:hypothetical protein
MSLHWAQALGLQEEKNGKCMNCTVCGLYLTKSFKKTDQRFPDLQTSWTNKIKKIKLGSD